MNGRPGRDAPLDLDPDTFREAGHELVDRIADFLATMRERRVAPGEAPPVVREALEADAPLPEEGEDVRTVLAEVTDLVLDHSTFNGHPRFFGYITSSAAPAGALADLLAAAVNPNVGSWTLAPMATEIEAQTVRWIADLLGYPRDTGGLLVSGGNVANFVGFFAARVAALGAEVREEGARAPAEGGSGRPRVYGSRETHTWIEKAADLSGIGTDAIRWIPTDERHRIRVDALERAIDDDLAAGDRPLLVVGTAGTVSTGALDPLDALATVCRERDLWFHVDGAYGAFGALLPDPSPDYGALAKADSVAVDPHKWLYAPLEAGCALVRDPRRLREAFSYHPPYYHFGVEATNYVDYGPQNSRGFRALKVWVALRQVGRAGYRRMIADDVRLAEELHRAASEHPELEALTRELSIATFRYVPTEVRTDAEAHAEYLDELNRATLDRIERSGEAFVSNAVLHGRFVLRACIVNFRTRLDDVRALPEIVASHGRAAHAELRG